jgi:hypothetical protein
VNKYIPALNTAKNLADLFRQTGRIKKAEELYGKALFGVEALFGRLSGRYRGCGTKWVLVCVGKGYETKMNDELRVQSVLYLSKCYPNPNSIKCPSGASAIVYSLRYGHLQNRLRPLSLKKNCEHRPPHLFLALTPYPLCHPVYSAVPGHLR